MSSLLGKTASIDLGTIQAVFWNLSENVDHTAEFDMRRNLVLGM